MPSNLPSKLSVDFSGVEDKRGSDIVPEGDYLSQIVGCELKTKKDDSSRPYLNWKLRVVEPSKYAGKTLYYITSLVPESLWNLRNFLVDVLGEDKVPKKAVDVPLAKIVAAKPKVGVTVEDDEYKGKPKSKVVSSFSKADWANLAGGTAKSKDEDSDEETAEEATEEISEDDDDMDEIDVDDI